MREKLLKKRCAADVSLAIAVAVGFLSYYAFIYKGLALRYAPLAALPALLLFLYAHVTFARATPRAPTRGERISFGLIFVFNTLLAICALSGLIRYGVQYGFGNRAKISLILLLFFCLIAIAEAVFFARFVGFSRPRLPDWKKQLPYWILGALLIALSAGTLSAWLRWDSMAYYTVLGGKNPISLIRARTMRLADHASYAATLVYVFVNMLTGAPLLGAHLIALMQLLCGTFFFYRIVRRVFPEWSRWSLLAATAIFAFSPFTFGIVYTVNLEQFLLFGFVMFFFARAEQLPMVEVAAAILICFSKETGAPMLAATVAALMLCSFLSRREWSRRGALRACNLGVNLPILGVGLCWLFDLRFFSWSEGNAGSSYTVEEAVQQVERPVAFNAFGYNELYFDEKMLTANVMNFNWLFLLLIALGAVFALIYWKRDRITPARADLLVGSLAAYGVAMTVGLLFITHNHARYNLITGVLLYFPAMEAMHRIGRKNAVRTALAACTAALLLVQSYRTVDPLMLAKFPRAEKGHGRIVYTENRVIARQGGDTRYAPFVLSDNALYNREIYDMDRALDRAFGACEIDGDTCFVFSSELQTNYVGANVSAEYILLGWGFSGITPDRVCWDADKQARVFTQEDLPEMHVAFVASEQELSAVMEQYARVYYVQMPYYDDFFAQSIAPGYQTTQTYDEVYRGWRFTVHRIGEANGSN